MSDLYFSFSQMLHGMERYASSVQTYLTKLENQTGKGVNIGTMFEAQFTMQILSQYIEAVSNTLTAVNNEMRTMATAIKGQ